MSFLTIRHRSDGSLIAHMGARDGRIFIIEREPLLDAAQAPGNHALGLTLYGLPDHTYRIESQTAVGSGGAWTEEVSVRLDGTYQRLESPVAPGPARFFRAVEK